MVIDSPETDFVEKFKVFCDGGEGALGHPRIWLLISTERGWVECPYCDKRMIHKSFKDKITL